MISYRGLLYNQKSREDAVGYETTLGHQGASVLLLLLIPVCSVSSHNWIISSDFTRLLPLPRQSISLVVLLFTSSLSTSPLHSFALLPSPGPQRAWLNTQANVSLFKETQVVDTLAIFQDQNEELLWSVVAVLHVDLSKTILRGPTWAKTFPQGC